MGSKLAAAPSVPGCRAAAAPPSTPALGCVSRVIQLGPGCPGRRRRCWSVRQGILLADAIAACTYRVFLSIGEGRRVAGTSHLLGAAHPPHARSPRPGAAQASPPCRVAGVVRYCGADPHDPGHPRRYSWLIHERLWFYLRKSGAPCSSLFVGQRCLAINELSAVVDETQLDVSTERLQLAPFISCARLSLTQNQGQVPCRMGPGPSRQSPRSQPGQRGQALYTARRRPD
jgi:hypothetical protein